VDLENAQQELERKRPLVEHKIVSAGDWDRVQNAHRSAQAGVAASRAQELSKGAAIRAAEAALSMSKAQLTNTLAQVKQKQAALRQAQIDVDRTYIRAPVTGTVVDRAVSGGQTVAASLQTPVLFTIAQDLQQMQLEASEVEVEVFWGHSGWFWRPRQLPGDAVGPFTTSTEAYESANAAVIRGANFSRWNSMLFFGTIEQPGVAGLRYNNFLSQTRNAASAGGSIQHGQERGPRQSETCARFGFGKIASGTMTTRLELAEGIAEAAGYVVVWTGTVRAIKSIEARLAIGFPITNRELSDVLFACAAGWRSKTFLPWRGGQGAAHATSCRRLVRAPTEAVAREARSPTARAGRSAKDTSQSRERICSGRAGRRLCVVLVRTHPASQAASSPPLVPRHGMCQGEW
jgi:biotin carboxyl carrier protein